MVSLAEKRWSKEIRAAYGDATARFVALQSEHPYGAVRPRHDNGTLPHNDIEASKGEDEIKTHDRDT